MSGTERFAATRARSLLAIGLAAAITIALVVVATAGAASTPPFEPDPDSLGGLRFFNAAGVEITSGNVADAPFAAYIQTSGVGRLGDTRATLFGYLPKNGVDTSGWSGDPLTASPIYPNSGAPAPLNASPLPLVSLVAGDGTLAQLQASFPNTAPAGDPYQGLYQLRVKTSGPGQLPGATYYSADIQIVGTAWSVVYSNLPPAPTTSTTTSTVPPTTSTVPPTTSTVPPTTSTVPPTTSTVPPTTSTVPPTTSTVPPTTSTVPPTTSTVPPTTSTVPPTTSTVPPTTSTVPPTTSTVPPTTSTVPPTTSTVPPSTTTTAVPPSTTTTTVPPSTTTTTAAPSTSTTTTPPTKPSVTIAKPSAPVGGTVQLSSTGWKAGEKIDAAIHSDPVSLGQLTADNSGAVTATFVVPAGIAPGSHTITLTGKAASGETVTVSTPVEVTASSTTAGSTTTSPVAVAGTGTANGSPTSSRSSSVDGESLAFTGTSALPLVLFAITCTASGVAFLLISRRRRAIRNTDARRHGGHARVQQHSCRP